MKIKKQIKIIVEKCVDDSFKDGRLIEGKALKYIKLFKSRSSAEAIGLLSEFLKELKYRIDSTTMTVESPIPLFKSDMDKIKRKFSSGYLILDSKLVLNPSLMGGLRVKIGDHLFEDSIRSRMEQVAEAIKS